MYLLQSQGGVRVELARLGHTIRARYRRAGTIGTIWQFLPLLCGKNLPLAGF